MTVSSLAVIFALIAGAGNLIGGLLVTLPRSWSRYRLFLLIAVGSGYMIAASVMRMLPVSLEQLENAPFFVLLGFLAVHLVEHTFTTHFHFGEETHPHEVGRLVGFSALTGLLLHTLFDGIAIGSGFHFDPALGVVVSLAVVLHKVPEGVTIASIMLAGGHGRGRSLASAAAIGVATLLGVLLLGLVASVAAAALAFSAGVTVYVAASDLVPEINNQGRVSLALGIPAGVALFFLTEGILKVVGPS
jgi:zinc transporter ZupT